MARPGISKTAQKPLPRPCPASPPTLCNVLYCVILCYGSGGWKNHWTTMPCGPLRFTPQHQIHRVLPPFGNRRPFGLSITAPGGTSVMGLRRILGAMSHRRVPCARSGGVKHVCGKLIQTKPEVLVQNMLPCITLSSFDELGSAFRGASLPDTGKSRNPV